MGSDRTLEPFQLSPLRRRNHLDSSRLLMNLASSPHPELPTLPSLQLVAQTLLL
jgi:hypothetical protein